MDEQKEVRVAGASGIARRLEKLQIAVTAGGQYFDPHVSARAQDDLRRTQKRTALGTDLTVAALVGGTGSGKSSLFNAITGLQFADSGDIRPMTDRPAACSYGVEATELLDYLAIDHDRRIRYDSTLSTGLGEFDRLILIDLPDHDSVAVAHSLEVERLLPMVDILIWVLDPQKYADQVLHASYMEKLAERADVMVVALNQIDRVLPSQRDVLVDDVRQLLARDGLADVPVIMTSAVNGDGLDALAEKLRVAMHRPSVAAQTAMSELDAIARRLHANVGQGEADVHGEQCAEMIDRIAGASGVGAAGESIRNAGRSLFATAYVQPEKLGNSMAVAIRDGWIGYVRRGLPKLWQDAVVSDIASAERLRNAVGNAVRAVKLPQLNRTPAWVLCILALIVFGAGCILGAVGIPSDSAVVRAAVIGIGVVLGILGFVVAKLLLRRQAAQLAQSYEDNARKAIETVVAETMVAGPARVLDKHEKARCALDSFVVNKL